MIRLSKMNFVVSYIESNTMLKRWGYVTEDAYVKVMDAHTFGDEQVEVYLPDGTTGSAYVKDLSLVNKFASFI